MQTAQCQSAKPPFLGFGLGLRAQHYDEILNGNPPIDWFEVISENYMLPGGQPLRMLDRICERYPVVMHGVSLSIASTAPPNFEYLQGLKDLAERVEPKWVSDHLCWTGVHGKNLHDLLPIPYTKEALDHVVSRVQLVQDFLGRAIVLENVSTYVQFNNSEMTEWEFLSELSRRSGCWLLFDVNNVYVSAFNHGYDPLTFLERDSGRPGRAVSHGRPQPYGHPHHRHPRPSGMRGRLGSLCRGAQALRPGLDHDRARRQHPAARRTAARSEPHPRDRRKSLAAAGKRAG